MSIDDIVSKFYALYREDLDAFRAKHNIHPLSTINDVAIQRDIKKLCEYISEPQYWSIDIDVWSIIAKPKVYISNPHFSRLKNFARNDHLLSANDSFDTVKKYHIKYIQAILFTRVKEISYTPSFVGKLFLPNKILLDKLTTLLNSGIEECQKKLSIEFSKVDDSIADRISKLKDLSRASFVKEVQQACQNLFESVGSIIDDEEFNCLITSVANEELAKRGMKAFT